MENGLQGNGDLMESEIIVSVLMTVYNREQYIAEAIESVLGSTFKNFELIIVDDCSVDNSVAIAQKFANNDKRISVYKNKSNLGDYPNRNVAASYAKGKYIKYLDSDDKFYDFSLGYCVNMMEQNPNAAWGLLSFTLNDEGVILSPEQSLYRHFFKKPFLTIGPDGSIFKKDFFINIGKFSTNYGPANDYYTNIICAGNGNLILMTRDFFYYRIHEGQEKNNQYGYLYNNYRLIKDANKLLKTFFSKNQILYINNKNKRRFIFNILKYYFKTFNLPKTLFAIKQAHFTLKDAYDGIIH